MDFKYTTWQISGYVIRSKGVARVSTIILMINLEVQHGHDYKYTSSELNAFPLKRL